jgi:hypothetical protein
MKNSIILIFLMLSINFLSIAQDNIQIVQPIMSTEVDQMNNIIRINARNGVPANECIIVFIQDPNKNWWPYFNVSAVSGSNNWEVTGVQFGMPIDVKKIFNIVAIKVSNSVQTYGLGIPANPDGSIRVNDFGQYLQRINSNSRSSIVSVKRR